MIILLLEGAIGNINEPAISCLDVDAIVNNNLYYLDPDGSNNPVTPFLVSTLLIL